MLRRRRPRGVGGKSSQLLINIIDIPGPPLSAAGKPPARPCAATQRKSSTRRIFISKFLPTDSGISSLFDPLIFQVLFVPQRCKIKGFVSRLLAKLPCHGGSEQEEISVLQEGCYFFLISPSINRALKPKYWLTSDILLMKPPFHAIYSYRHYSALN